MGKLSSILHNSTDNGLLFWCPGCEMAHRIQHGAGTGPRWGWNGDVGKPTFTPSVLVREIRLDMSEAEEAAYDAAFEACGYTSEILDDPRFSSVCHSYVTDGRIKFLGDCTHGLAGQTVDLPAWPERVES